MRIPTLALLVLGASCQAALSQTPPSPISRLDVSASVGWFHSKHVGLAEFGPNWADSLFRGAGVGYYWTDHLKSEIEAGWAGESRAVYVTRREGPNAPFAYIYERHYFRTVRVSIDQAYQFERNAWVHPFVAAGVDVDRERDRLERPGQNVPTALGAPTTFLPPFDTETTTVVVRPFVKAGFKAYLSERAFFVGEAKLGFDSRLERVVWKAGVGVDF